MKSVLQAVNLLTVAFGNVIVIIVAEAKAFEQVIDLTHNSMALIQPSNLVKMESVYRITILYQGMVLQNLCFHSSIVHFLGSTLF